MTEYVCSCGPNEYCAADDCHGATGEARSAAKVDKSGAGDRAQCFAPANTELPPAPEPSAAPVEREWYSVQEGLWKSLWLVLRGARVRQWKYLTVGSVPNLMSEEDA